MHAERDANAVVSRTCSRYGRLGWAAADVPSGLNAATCPEKTRSEPWRRIQTFQVQTFPLLGPILVHTIVR